MKKHIQPKKFSATKDESNPKATQEKILRIFQRNNEMKSNCTEWLRYMKDEVNKFGDTFKSQTRHMRFRPYNTEKEVEKHKLVPEQLISERVWRVRTRETDQVAINAIADETEQEDLYNELYTKWAEETTLSNAGIKSANTLREATLKKIPDVAREREDIDAHIFALILQHMEEDSRDTVESHIIQSYGKPYYPGKTGNKSVTAGDGGIDDISIGQTGAEDQATNISSTSSSTLSDVFIMDVDFETAEKRNDWIWLLIAAEESHVLKLVGEDEDELERCQEREDKALKAMRHKPGQHLTTFSRMFKEQVKLCNAFGLSYKESTLMRIYMDAMNKELFQKEWDEYQNKSLKYTFGNSLRSMIDEMHRRINRLANENPDKVSHFLNSKHREVTLKTSDNIKSNNKPSKSTKSTPSKDGKVPCDICGDVRHDTEKCFHYHHHHSSVEEAIEAYKLFKSKREEKNSSDGEGSGSEEEAEPSKAKYPTKGTVADPPKKINLMKSNLSVNEESKLPVSKDSSLESDLMLEDKIILGYDQASDLGVIPERLSKELKVAKGTSYLTGFGGAETRSTGYVKNTFGYSIVDKSEYLKNTVIISHYQIKDCWNYVYHDHSHMSLISKGGEHTIHFEVDPAKFGTTMPQAIISLKEFYHLYNESNDICNRELCNMMKEYTWGDGEYRSFNKVNYKYLSKYESKRGAIKLLRCRYSNFNPIVSQLKPNYMKPAETIQSGDLIQFGDLPPVAFEQDYGQQVIANGLDPSVQKIGVKSPGSPSCVIRAEKIGVMSPGSPSRVI
jgi:hypothetical protein